MAPVWGHERESESTQEGLTSKLKCEDETADQRMVDRSTYFFSFDFIGVSLIYNVLALGIQQNYLCYIYIHLLILSFPDSFSVILNL